MFTKVSAKSTLTLFFLEIFFNLNELKLLFNIILVLDGV